MNKIFGKHSDLFKTVIRKIADETLYKPDFSGILSELPDDRDIHILGAGKAGVQMARAVETELGTRIRDGIVIVPAKAQDLIKRIQFFEGAHPFPDAGSVSSSYELREYAMKIPLGDTVLFLLSGGASSLLCIPAGRIELDELRATFKLLLECGADIDEINTVRKHLSETGGGHIGKLLAEHEVWTLILSDVPGDKPEVVGSAPTVADPTTFKQAFQVLKHYNLWKEVPHAVRVHLTKGMQGDIDETVKPDSADWKRHHVEVIPGAQQLATKVGVFLKDNGYDVRVASQAYDDDVKQVAEWVSSEAIDVLKDKGELKLPAALIYYGESTVSVNGPGKGGRNQELALHIAKAIDNEHSISALSFATDGRDGPTEAAGAQVHSATLSKAREMDIDPETYLQNNDSFHFHQKLHTTIETGETGLNFMDLQILLIDQ